MDEIAALDAESAEMLGNIKHAMSLSNGAVLEQSRKGRCYERSRRTNREHQRHSHGRHAGPKRQRCGLIPAWGNAPGTMRPTRQGLKARLNRTKTESGFQPSGVCETVT